MLFRGLSENSMGDKKSILSAIIISSILALADIVFLTIFGELNQGFKSWLTGTFSHHWIGKSVISVIVFMVSVPIFYILRLRNVNTTVIIWLLVAVVNLSFGILLAFFLFEVNH